MTIPIQDFIAAERMRAIDFYEWYTLKHRDEPEAYPLDLAPEMWPVHYRIWERE